jgi:hypothetical protein
VKGAGGPDNSLPEGIERKHIKEFLTALIPAALKSKVDTKSFLHFLINSGSLPFYTNQRLSQLSLIHTLHVT